jgi:hypothetical protein
VEGTEKTAAGVLLVAADDDGVADEAGTEAGEMGEDALIAALSARACTKLCDP